MHVDHIPNVIAVACILHNGVKFTGSTSMMLGYWISVTTITLNLQLLPLEMVPVTNQNV